MGCRGQAESLVIHVNDEVASLGMSAMRAQVGLGRR